MFPFANTLAAGDQDTIYVASYFFANGGQSPTLASLGAVAGDFAIHFGGNPPVSAGGPWLFVGSDGSSSYYTKSLSAVDVAGAVSISEAGRDALVIYRGPIVTVAIRSTFSNGPPVAGFVKHRAHLGLVAGAVAFRAATINDLTSVITPATFLLRGRAQSPSDGTATGVFDRLSPPNATYVDNAPLSANSRATISILELRSE